MDTNAEPTEGMTVAELASLVDDLRERVDEQNERIEDLEAENERLRDRVDDLEEQPSFEIADNTDPIKSLFVEGAPIGQAIRSKATETDVDTKLDELKADLEASNPTPDAEKSGSTTLYQPETPIEQVVAMPERMTDDQLTANQQRARFVAADIRDYAQSVPAGWAISSTEMYRILQAYDDSGHTETVARVFDILDDLGGDDIQIVERRGTRRVVFSDDLVARLDRLDRTSHDVVMEGTG